MNCMLWCTDFEPATSTSNADFAESVTAAYQSAPGAVAAATHVQYAQLIREA